MASRRRDAVSHRPFAALGELVERERLRLAPETDKPAPPATPIAEELSDEEAFERAMADVRPLGWSATPLRLPPPVELRETGGEREALEELAAFVAGEGSLDPFAIGEGVEGATSGRGRRFLARLRNGEFAVQAHLDLHGLRLDEAEAAVDAFLRDAFRLGHTCVRIVHGRGRHSASEPAVLKRSLTRWLRARRLRRLVCAFASARHVDGGGGALYVLLYRKVRPPRK